MGKHCLLFGLLCIYRNIFYTLFLRRLLYTEPVLPFQMTTDAPLLLRPRYILYLASHLRGCRHARMHYRHRNFYHAPTHAPTHARTHTAHAGTARTNARTHSKRTHACTQHARTHAHTHMNARTHARTHARTAARTHTCTPPVPVGKLVVI